MKPACYRDLVVWQRSVRLAAKCYALTAEFPAQEKFALSSQIRRAASSVAANIAEGNGRAHTREYVQFLHVARGSLFELITYLEIAAEAHHLSESDSAELRELTDHVGRMLTRLAERLRSRAVNRRISNLESRISQPK